MFKFIEHWATVDIFNFEKVSPKLKIYPHILFAGKSNVGKSSLINALCRKKIAFTSKTPGRTRFLYFYMIDKKWLLVDSPGFGYTHNPEDRKRFKKLMDLYFNSNFNIKQIFLLVDVRFIDDPLNVEAYSWFKSLKLPIHLITTKSDKLRKDKLRFTEELIKDIFPYTEYTFTSTKKSMGISELIKKIKNTVY